ncbi:phiSA1p31-related protein [Streptomyces galilaeus]|uniref:PhiSA1p31-related protein n=1 Tax=Streptomyces galilaeus TaxID=33899 RepID=A0ABW9IPV5_STRGJ
MGQTFSEGDTVRTSHRDAPTGTIAFGPFRALRGGPERYMVQTDAGTAVSVLAQDINPHVTFEVGEEATELAMGRTMTVQAGPFKGAGNNLEHYVVQVKATGNYSWVRASMLTKLTPKPAPRTVAENVFSFSAEAQHTFTLDCRTYDLRGEYADSQGDVWRFNGRRDPDGMPLMDCPLHVSLTDYRLAQVVRSYGPLSRA